MWFCGEFVAPPIQLMRLAVAWAALYSGLVECVCSVDLWVLCAICGIGYKLPVAKGTGWCMCGRGLAPRFRSSFPAYCGTI